MQPGDPDHASVPPGVSAPSDGVEAQLQRILASAGFRNSQRRSDLLRWLVTRVLLEGDSKTVKEHLVGMAVFGKSESWDPRIDPVVRVEFNRVRQKLREFYEHEGKEDPILIEFSSRGYVPVFTQRMASPVPEPEALTEQPAVPVRAGHRLRRTRFWAAAAAILLTASGAFALWNLRFREPQPPLSAIAVLPFLDLSADHQDEYLSDGFTDELTNTLASLRGLDVVARTSAFQFKGKSIDVREIGRFLHVGTILEGSILRGGTSIRVVAQLNRASDGMHLWAATYDREVKDILRVQDEITASIAEALRVQLAGGALPSVFEPGEEAHDQFLHGIYERNKVTPESLRKAVGYFEYAIRLSPRYARAYAELGAVYFARASYAGLDQQEELRKAKTYLEDGVALDPNLGWAESNLAWVNYVLNWDWRGAEMLFHRALRATSDSATRSTWGGALMTRGRFAESQAQFREAIARDPLNLAVRINFAVALIEEGDSAAADEQLRICFERVPGWFPAHLIAAYNAIYKNQPASALDHLNKASDAVPLSPLILPAQAAALILSNKRADALALLKNIESQGPKAGFVCEHLAIVHAILGDADGVFRWLEQSAEAHEQQILYIRVDPILARYRSDPRMIALERRVGLLP